MQISEAIYFPRIVIVSLEPILESIFFVIIKYWRVLRTES